MVLVLAAGHGLAALACSCSGSSTSPEWSFSHSDVVFEGEATDVSRRYLALAAAGIRFLLFGEKDPGPVESWGVSARFRVTRVWKGQVAEEVVVFTDRDTSACGFPFDEDERYVVFGLVSESGALETSICSATIPSEAAAATLSFLQSQSGAEEAE